MPVSFLTPHRTVLLITDDALCVYKTSARGVRLVETVPWGSQDFESNVAQIITKDCGSRPVVILNDMVEQHYRKERVIRAGVGAMDKAGMIRRKLSVAFPNYPVRSAFALKEKIPKTEKAAPSDLYIFAALPETSQLSQTIAAVRRSVASIAGLCLLPVESADMVAQLASKLTKKEHPKARWVVLVGQHRSGGFRQIVIRNGELALTRMTPMIDGAEGGDPQAWATEVHQEFNATMSYLSRFGFQPEDGLHVIVIGSPSATEALQPRMDGPYVLTCMAATEAAEMLGVSLGVQDSLQYADPLHVLWAGQKSRFTLPMKAPNLEQVSRPRQAVAGISFLLLCSAAFLGFQTLSEAGAISDLAESIDTARQQLAQLDVQYRKEVDRKEKLGFDVRLVQSSIAVHDSLETGLVKPLPLYRIVGHALGKDMRMDRMTIRKGTSLLEGVPDPSGLLPDTPSFTSVLQMSYPATADIGKGNAEVRGLRDRLAATLPGHKVTVTKFLKDYEYAQEIIVETGDLRKKDVEQDFVAEITILGPPDPRTGSDPL